MTEHAAASNAHALRPFATFELSLCASRTLGSFEYSAFRARRPR
jgi:hypothetical protein